MSQLPPTSSPATSSPSLAPNPQDLTTSPANASTVASSSPEPSCTENSPEQTEFGPRSATITKSQMMNRMDFVEKMKEKLKRKAGVKVLCLDGGGIRGLVEIEMLQYLSQEIYSDSTGVQLINQFDLICGTSAGGILSLALSQGFELATCRQIFFDLGAKIFKKKLGGGIFNYMWNGNFYSTETLEKLFQDYLGTNPFGEMIKRPVFVVSTDATYEEWKTVLFRSYEHQCCPDSATPPQTTPSFFLFWNKKKHHHIDTHTEEERNHATVFPTHEMPVSVCARATSAAPTYFKAISIEDRVFVDGGCTANNPSELGVFEAKRLWPDRNVDLVLSLGTGKPTEKMGSQNVYHILNEMIDICSSSESAHKRVKNWLKISMPQTAYFRFSPDSGQGSIPLDESNRQVLDKMVESTRQYMDSKFEHVKELKEVMLECKLAPPPYTSETSEILIDDFELL